MPDLPSGRVAFVFTDIEGSTALLTELGDASYQEVLGEHEGLLRACFSTRGGVEVKAEGDGLFIAFGDPAEAVIACCEAQRALAEHAFPHGRPIRVRMGVHCGEAYPRGHDYIALAVNQAARVMAAGHGGQVLLSSAAAEACDDRIDLRRLGLFLLKDFARPQPLVQVVLAGDAHPDLAEPRTPRARPHGVPLIRTEFVGRDRLLSRVLDEIEAAPVVSLIGTGGVGKTRIAHQLAFRLVGGFPGGVHFVSLAALTEPAHVAAAVASGLGVTGDTEGGVLTRIEEHVTERRTLLILDNCEHLIDAAATVIEAVTHSGVSHVLATSRERLNVEGEVVVDVDPLDDDESVQLFSQRVAAAGRSVALPRDAVLRFCRQLDGLPLGIELVAARARALDARGLERLMSDPLALTGAHRGQPALRQVIERSHELLTEDEQVLFARLSVFAGGWDLESAELVCRGRRLAEADIADLLGSLVEKSLVSTRHADDGTRYGMLALLRSYAAEQLAASDDGPNARQSHRAWCRTLTDRACASVDGPEFPDWLKRLDLEHANLLAALSSTDPAHQPGEQPVDVREDRLAIVGNALPYWIFQSRPGRMDLMRRVHFDGLGCAPHLRAIIAAELAHEHRGTAHSRALLQEAADLSEGHPDVQAVVLAYLAEDLLDAEDEDPTLLQEPVEETVTRALELARASGSISTELSVQAYGANVLLERCWETDDFGPAEIAYRALLDTAKSVGSVRRQAFALVALALIEGVYRRNALAAEPWARAAVDLLDGLRERSNSCLAHAVLALSSLENDDTVAARRSADVAVDMAIDSGFPHHEELAALCLGAVLVAEGALRDAAVVLGFVNDWYDPLKVDLLVTLDATLGEDERRRLVATGPGLAMRDLPGQPHSANRREPAA